jgi:hypothetical protein
MKVIVFNQINSAGKKNFYSPDFYFSDINFMIRPQENIVIALSNTSKYYHQTDQNQIVFARGNFFYKDQTCKLSVVVKNTFLNRTIVCHRYVSLTKLLTMPGISHSYSHILKKDIDKLLKQ